ncbi:MAG: ABC transporter ATP-binding protein [Clostridium sp.]|uniref:ABC transporter ATP-binding protein n=1 Tax=Clostridium sp. TaxID=1506 RepID=UPI003F3CFBE7
MIELKNVSTGYEKINVIEDISFNVKKNELFCIIGPNGCGKSTLLKAIANINKYDGSIKIQGKEINNINRKDLAKEVALMSQITEVYFSYTVYETISLGRYPHIKGVFGNLSENDMEIIDEVIKDLSLNDIQEKYINELSGGQLQRVFLARTFVQDPKIILLDEPTNHLDFKHQIELLDNLKKWCKQGERAVIGVLHDLNLVQMYAERVALIDNGKMVQIDTSQNILKSKEIESVYGVKVREFMIKVLEKWI